MLFYILLSLAAVAGGIYLTFRKTQKIESYSLKMTATIAVATAVLTYPYFRQSADYLVSLLETIKYGLDIITLDIDPDVIDGMTSAGNLFWLYKGLLYIFYVLAPVFASITILSFSRTLLDRFSMRSSNKVHMFSSLNENSLSVSEHIRENDPNANIIFFGWKDKDDSLGRRAKDLDAVMPNYGFKKFHLLKNKDYTFYQIDENDTDNLNSFINNYCYIKEKHPELLDAFEFKCFTDSNSIELIRKIDKFLSAQEVPLVNVSFINEENNLAYKLFHDLLNVIDTDKMENEFLIIGASEKGMSILKTMLWLFDQQGMYLTVDVVDRNARRIASYLKLSCPELMNAPLEEYIYMPVNEENWTEKRSDTAKNYMIRFFEADINSYALEEILMKKNVDPDMIFVTMKDDILSQTVTEKMQRILARKHDDIKSCPVAIHITNDNTFELLSKVNRDDNVYYFGNQRNRYKSIFEVNSMLEEMAQKVHLSYLNNTDKDIQKVLNESGYYRLSNHESSLAQALTVEYRVKYILNKTKGEPGSAKERIERYLKDEDNFKTLCEMEHTRWLTYQRTEGWTKPTLKQMKEIAALFGDGKTIKYNDLLLHPANVPNDQLREMERTADEILYDIKGEKYTKTDYYNKDGYIVGKIPEIISEELIGYIENKK